MILAVKNLGTSHHTSIVGVLFLNNAFLGPAAVYASWHRFFSGHNKWISSEDLKRPDLKKDNCKSDFTSLVLSWKRFFLVISWLVSKVEHPEVNVYLKFIKRSFFSNITCMVMRNRWHKCTQVSLTGLVFELGKFLFCKIAQMNLEFLIFCLWKQLCMKTNHSTKTLWHHQLLFYSKHRTPVLVETLVCIYATFSAFRCRWRLRNGICRWTLHTHSPQDVPLFKHIQHFLGAANLRHFIRFFHQSAPRFLCSIFYGSFF